MGRFIIWVLDGFGVGAMPDAAEYRAVDAMANTCVHVLDKNPGLRLPNMEKLGLMNILGAERNGMRFSDTATFGKSKLMHFGADTFYGHQEIMGTNPVRTCLQSFTSMYDKVAEALTAAGYRVKEYLLPNGAKAMGINDAAIVADNQANDPGQVYNVIGLSSVMPFEDILAMSRIIREQVQVTRVIAHACDDVTYPELEAAIVESWPGYGGIDTVALNIYEKNVQIRHLGYGVDETVQAPYLLGKHGVPVTHLGKFADLVANPFGKSTSCVNTEKLLGLLYDTLREQNEGLIAINVQETDLSGHEEDTAKYARILSLVDNALDTVLPLLGAEDRLIVMADHGNDPTNGSVLHSREYVPLMIYGHGVPPGDVGIRDTMSDVGATALDYFAQSGQYSGLDKEKTQNGISFLPRLQPAAQKEGGTP